MNKHLAIGFAAVWIVCGILSFGLMLHYYQTRFLCFAWPSRFMHILAALAAGVCGPIGFIHRFVVDHWDKEKTPWRFRFRLATPEESWNECHRRFPGLPKERWVSLKF